MQFYHALQCVVESFAEVMIRKMWQNVFMRHVYNIDTVKLNDLSRMSNWLTFYYILLSNYEVSWYDSYRNYRTNLSNRRWIVVKFHCLRNQWHVCCVQRAHHATRDICRCIYPSHLHGFSLTDGQSSMRRTDLIAVKILLNSVLFRKEKLPQHIYKYDGRRKLNCYARLRLDCSCWKMW